MKTVIVVEDEMLIRQGLIRRVHWEEHGCTLAGEAKNGKEGLKMIRQIRPDIVITDVRMPVMDGLEMLRQSKAEYGYDAIIISGFDDFDYARQAISLKVDEYLLKPIDISQLEILLSTLTESVSTATLEVRAANMVNARCESLTASEVAKEFCVSADHLSRLFKLRYGISLHEYITVARIRKACTILAEQPARKVYEVAEKVGYGDYKYFHQVFQKQVGISPTEYRKKISDSQDDLP